MSPIHVRYPQADEFMSMIAERRSVMPKRLGAPGPSQNELEMMLDAALTAPDHNQLCPWRVVLIGQNRRKALAEAFIQGRVRRKGKTAVTPEDIQREHDKAAHPPVMLAVVTNLTYDVRDVPIEEQYIALGAAMQNILLSAHAMGYGAIMLSGRRVDDEEVRSFIGVENHQHLVGFMCMGNIKTQPRNVVRSRFTDVLSEIS